MASPFPGMDPYLERHWGDVHADLVALARAALNDVLPPDLVARMEGRVVVDAVSYDRPEAEQHTESYVNILDADGGQLVTVIEVLSPSNKLAGEARGQYRRKRHELAAARVNLVEIDLFRRGAWRDLLLPVVAPADVRTAYRVITRRAHPPRRVELYPMPLRERLPRVPIALRPTNPPVALDLQALVNQAYRNGRYDRTRYDQPCDPPLEAEVAAWADDLLRAAGRR